MAFKKISQSSTSADNIEALYRDYKNRKIPGPLSHQVDIWRKYEDKETISHPNVALQLPTGSGKGLIGLGIGEWHRRKNKERVIYLCPTKQLVNQLAEQSINKYGIKVNSFTGEQAKYPAKIKSEYISAEAIAITTYSGLFNTNSFFKDLNQPHIIILDDAHSADNYIAKYWSLLIDKEKHKALFQVFVIAIKEVISPNHYSRLLSGRSFINADPQWVEKIPTPFLIPILSELIAILDENTKDNDLRYCWSVLRDHFYACHIYLSSTNILIRPNIPPTLTHRPFADAKQRIYMSATLGEGGELERLMGIEKIKRIHLDGWDRQGIGRRLFFFPECSLDQESSIKLTVDMTHRVSRSLVLVPDDKVITQFKENIPKESEYKIFNVAEIESSKQPFISNDKAIAIVSNRYDGIDLVDEECRLLIVNGLQRSTNLQERFLTVRMSANIIFIDRILTRIIQAVGRCTRNDTDYAAVVILGEELNNWLRNSERRGLFHPEIAAEIEYGIEQSKDISYDVFLENLDFFMKNKEEWSELDEGEKDIISRRDSLNKMSLAGVTELSNSVSHEIRYQYALWNGEFDKAVEEGRTVLTKLSGNDVQGYRTWWYYLTGSAAWLASTHGIASMESVARGLFNRAASATKGITWLYDLARLNPQADSSEQSDDSRLAMLIEGLEAKLISLGTASENKFEEEIRVIIDNLAKTGDKESPVFEEGHKRLGSLLGYESDNVETTAAPDPFWILNDDFCIVFEDHSPKNPQTSSIGVNKVRQAESHPTWIKENISSLRTNAEITSVMISSCKTIDHDAKTFALDTCYWNLEEFQEWALEAISVIRTLRRSFNGEPDLGWRERAMQAYKDKGLDPSSFVKILKTKKLRDLPLLGKQNNDDKRLDK
jgi:hypothetical protein